MSFMLKQNEKIYNKLMYLFFYVVLDLLTKIAD